VARIEAQPHHSGVRDLKEDETGYPRDIRYESNDNCRAGLIKMDLGNVSGGLPGI
jgi:hypothetical protein